MLKPFYLAFPRFYLLKNVDFSCFLFYKSVTDLPTDRRTNRLTYRDARTLFEMANNCLSVIARYFYLLDDPLRLLKDIIKVKAKNRFNRNAFLEIKAPKQF